ncbi:endonuclease/exonuclease/phosphatase family protein [Nocardia altamirensis]|uniref:endonuclease/exonuclease/phosphatase family protein n=1 Tax=Nocardia altamirensis TaxID=472158 RepID=UPI001FDEB160|nr:endonuclease/exonuclease/phosphatase family protein [Nocardia altamirensis]
MRWKSVVAWLAVVPGVVWAVVRVAGLDTWYPMVQLIAFTPQIAAISVVPVVLNVLLRQRYAAVAAGLVTIVLAACVVPRAISDGDPLNGAKGEELRVMSANVLMGKADVAELARLATDVDVVAVQELTPEFAESFGKYFPHRVVYPAPGVGGSGVFSRLPLRDAGVRRNPWGFMQAIAEIPERGVSVESAHPAAPSSRAAVEPWRESFRRQLGATPDGPLRILAGDFNATIDHSVMRALVDSGYRDAAQVVGKGLVGTWGPYDGDRIPPVTLDRVLADRRIGVRDVQVLDLRGSDHRPVRAVLVLP